MAIKISGTTVIDDSRNIQNIGIITATSFVGSGSGLTGVGIGTTGSINTSGNITAGVATFRSINVPPVPITFSPAIGATSVSQTSNIVITFNETVIKGSGNITLRESSVGGTAFSTIAVSSGTVTISGGAVTIDPTPTFPSGSVIFPVVDAGAFTGLTTSSVNALINNYSFTAASGPALGSSYEGGNIICCANPTRWVVAPLCSEAVRGYASFQDGVTLAQSCTGCSGWFIPTNCQHCNPGYVCRQYWTRGGSAYWTSSPRINGFNVPHYFYGSGGLNEQAGPNTIAYSRAFRCVTY